MPWTAPFSDGVDVLFLIAFAEAVLFGDPPAPMPLPDGLTASWGNVLCTLDIRLLPALVVGLTTDCWPAAMPSLSLSLSSALAASASGDLIIGDPPSEIGLRARAGDGCWLGTHFSDKDGWRLEGLRPVRVVRALSRGWPLDRVDTSPARSWRPGLGGDRALPDAEPGDPAVCSGEAVRLLEACCCCCSDPPPAEEEEEEAVPVVSRPILAAAAFDALAAAALFRFCAGVRGTAAVSGIMRAWIR